MRILNVTQGSPEWDLVRLNSFNASEAAAMMATHKNIKRDELLKFKATSLQKEVNAWVQKNLFDKGHEAEAAIRPHIETIIGDDLFPVVGKNDEYNLLASFDGLTLDGRINFEHKMWNEELAERVRQVNAGTAELDPHYYWQLEQQHLVSGAEKTIFVVSDGTPEKMVFCWYTPVAGRAGQLLLGWQQFDEDLKNYKAPEVTAEIVVEGVTILPAITMIAAGQVSVTDNFAVFEKCLVEFLQGELICDPKTDGDFALLALQIKALKNAEDMLEAAGNSVLAQIEAVNSAMNKKDSLAALVRDNRLMAEKLLKAKKDQIRLEIVTTSEGRLTAHIRELSDSIGYPLPTINGNFSEAIKGKKTVDSLASAANDALAKAKIEASAIANTMRSNLGTFTQIVAEDVAYLFNDIGTLIQKQADDFKAALDSRIAKHEQQMRIRETEAAAAAIAKAEAAAAAAAAAQAIATPAAVQAPLVAPANDSAQISLAAETQQVEQATTDEAKLLEAVTEWAKRNGCAMSATMELRGIITGYLTMKRRKAA